MKTAFIVTFVTWLIVVLSVSCTRANENEFMARQVESVRMERANYIREVDLGWQTYNPEFDKSLWIEIDLLCSARGRTMSQCWLQMLFTTGAEFSPYKGF